MSEVKSANQQPESSERQAQESTKRLRTTAAVSAHQKEWFTKTRERINAGEPLAITNEGELEEIFMVMDIPTIGVHWWSANIAAHKMSAYYFDLLDEKGYDACRYCALPLGCTMDHNPELAPWGGLPRPTVIAGGGVPGSTCDALNKINELWAREYNAFVFPLEVTQPTKRYSLSWERIKDHWDEVIEPHRIDLRVEGLKELIRFLEITTGKTFSMAKLREVMELVNELNEYLSKVNDLIGETVPCPVSTAEENSVYRIQWHRGTQAGLDLAKMLYEEVKERVDNGVGAYENEKLRLRWMGVGLWHNTAFWRYFEEKYGAVFVGGYMGVAEAYIRKILNNDPLRALAGRSLFLLRSGPEWAVEQAKKFKINGVVQLAAQRCRVSTAPLTRMVLEKAGIPVLPIYVDNVDARTWDDAKIKSLVSNFIETRLS